jgi:thiazole synthase
MTAREPLTIAGVPLASRLFLGTGGLPRLDLIAPLLEAAKRIAPPASA